MTLQEIIMAIQAAEQLIPVMLSFVNAIHPPTTAAPTRAALVLQATSSALQSAGVAAETVAAIKDTMAVASAAAAAATTTASVPAQLATLQVGITKTSV